MRHYVPQLYKFNRKFRNVSMPKICQRDVKDMSKICGKLTELKVAESQLILLALNNKKSINIIKKR